MKTVQINTVLGTGSTGKIVLGLHNATKEIGSESCVAYGRVTSMKYRGEEYYLVGNKPDMICHVLVNFFTGKNAFASRFVTQKLLNWLDLQNPDLIHLHNLHGFYVNVEILFDYIKLKNIPVVWTFHDCWPFTGQCAHFDFANCDKWKTGCYKCPIYRSNYPYSLFKDNSKNNYERKKNTFTGVKNLTIVTPSNWLKQKVDQSFLNEYPVEVIPNGINTEIFSHEGRRPELYIPNMSGKKILLGVANVWTKNKGLDYLIKLADDLINKPDYLITIIGLNNDQISKIKKKPHPNVLPLKRTSSVSELAAWYRSAYAFINPTLEDTFPTTNLESLSCGTPVITFNTGGSPESLTTDCGVVVEKGNYNALKDAILDLQAFDPVVCHDRALEYTIEKANNKYLELYQSLIK